MKSGPSKAAPGDWMAEYEKSHQNPANRICHLFGIPMIALSLPLAVVVIFAPGFWPLPVGFFVIGWLLQFVGHAIEGKRPAFVGDWRFLFIGLRWWFATFCRRK